MNKTEFRSRLRKAAELQAEKKRERQEKVKALVEKMRARSAQAPARPPIYDDEHDVSGLLEED